MTATANANLEHLIESHSLPLDTRKRFKNGIASLQRFPELGSPLGGVWHGYRFVLGPWRWMVIVYEYRNAEDAVVVVTVQDGRSKVSPTMKQ